MRNKVAIVKCFSGYTIQINKKKIFSILSKIRIETKRFCRDRATKTHIKEKRYTKTINNKTFNVSDIFTTWNFYNTYTLSKYLTIIRDWNKQQWVESTRVKETSISYIKRENFLSMRRVVLW